tara:strand:- start:17 stop:436 length:420 start_codon:yes stop_codon:yes gene_type:complete
MRGIVFRCKGFVKSLDKEYFYVISNGITRLEWSNIHTPANVKVINLVKKKGADSVTFKYALDAIPSQRNRRTLIRACYRVMTYGGDIEFLCEQGDNSGIGKMKGFQWNNNKPMVHYMPEIEEYFTVVKVSNNAITAIKD